MGIFLDEPKFPVIDRSPSAGTTVGNFNFSDYLKITAITAGSLPVGYLAGGSVHIRGPSMYTAGLIGLMGGFMFAYQCSAGRLMGMFPNDGEVARYKR
ncbi:hypothetical protein MPTK1_8g11910 [Marchantia polymorpha subsp. ruderalis]|uniref:NADH-ubiquinone oxidoreductase 21kDa subunit N-terminal domain-containing protein n=1 Tax=Marchantia polymorpha TaxID=3197 RepID=A0A2R6XMI3_MARPO|nr:hypothetical protein Mapa_008086 [Marchantia paleacea]PTQ47236.1 hypothetical protein MARPO_0008s0024 [Marchantia polymorpha]BBN19587.1 hypothetical protein Mp_8g11910 [Marchantia polymorpha subsp. ruderalis]|eukprot:PTQ47236.1 hypothetical protein MARPO_0008s0024 [Marchantia polymorpha]